MFDIGAAIFEPMEEGRSVSVPSLAFPFLVWIGVGGRNDGSGAVAFDHANHLGVKIPIGLEAADPIFAFFLGWDFGDEWGVSVDDTFKSADALGEFNELLVGEAPFLFFTSIESIDAIVDEFHVGFNFFVAEAEPFSRGFEAEGIDDFFGFDTKGLDLAGPIGAGHGGEEPFGGGVFLSIFGEAGFVGDGLQEAAGDTIERFDATFVEHGELAGRGPIEIIALVRARSGHDDRDDGHESETGGGCQEGGGALVGGSEAFEERGLSFLFVAHGEADEGGGEVDEHSKAAEDAADVGDEPSGVGHDLEGGLFDTGIGIFGGDVSALVERFAAKA